MTLLVTGAGGFLGRNLVRHALNQGRSVVGWSRGAPPEDLADRPGLTWRTVGYDDSDALRAQLADAAPTAVVHLAAQSLPGVSWDDPTGTYAINIEGTIRLVQAMRDAAPRARLIMVSSSSVCAPSPDGTPIDETWQFGETSPYSVSKLSAELSARLLGERFGLAVVTVRPFFVIGPEKEGDVCSDFARRVVRAERSGEPVIRVGNLDAVRDFLDIEDAVAGFDRILVAGEPGTVYNLCSGRGTAIREIVEGYANLAKVPLRVDVDPALVRPIDDPVKVGNPARLQALGWSPATPLATSLDKILTWWLAR